jgi:heme/copper-type cytochrome/quinol oxidase subunit 2
MEPMSFKSTLIVILIFLIFFGILIWMLVSWGKKFKHQKDTEKFEYDMFYLWLKACIEKYELHRDNYSFLKTKLIELGQLKHKDKERTSVLTVQFFRRFERFALDDVDEHSPKAVFGENDYL